MWNIRPYGAYSISVSNLHIFVSSISIVVVSGGRVGATVVCVYTLLGAKVPRRTSVGLCWGESLFDVWWRAGHFGGLHGTNPS